MIANCTQNGDGQSLQTDSLRNESVPLLSESADVMSFIRTAAVVALFAMSVCSCDSGQNNDELRVRQTFVLEGISRVLVRASRADIAKVSTSAVDKSLTISGVPTGGALGYDPPADEEWEETPPGEWGMQFVSKVYGTDLVVSTKNEIGYLHHQYFLDSLIVVLPPDVEIVLEARKLTGSGKPDLDPPVVRVD